MMDTNTYTVVIQSLPAFSLTWNDFLPVCAAAILGAAMALYGNYRLMRSQWRRDVRRERTEELKTINVAVNRALIALFARANSLRDFRLTLDKFRDSSDRWLMVPVIPKHEDLTPPLDTRSLEFLLNENCDPNLLVQLLLIDKNYFMLWRTLEDRNILKDDHHNTPQEITPRSPKGAQMKQLTDYLYDETDILADAIEAARQRLRAATIKTFPHASIIDFELHKQDAKQADGWEE